LLMCSAASNRDVAVIRPTQPPTLRMMGNELYRFFGMGYRVKGLLVVWLRLHAAPQNYCVLS